MSKKYEFEAKRIGGVIEYREDSEFCWVWQQAVGIPKWAPYTVFQKGVHIALAVFATGPLAEEYCRFKDESKKAQAKPERLPTEE